VCGGVRARVGVCVCARARVRVCAGNVGSLPTWVVV
jgi:hypothetical protein